MSYKHDPLKFDRWEEWRSFAIQVNRDAGYLENLPDWYYLNRENLTREQLQKADALCGNNACCCDACSTEKHRSDCAVHNEPEFPNGPCNCGVFSA